MRLAGMPEPEFQDQQGVFTVRFRKQEIPDSYPTKEYASLLEFCSVYRTRQEIADFLHIKTAHYAIKNHIAPLIQKGVIEMEFPDKPRSPKQRYRTGHKNKAAQ